MPRLKLALAGLLFASPAFAQVGGGADMNGGMGGGGAPMGGGAAAGAQTGEAIGMEPKSIIDRSYVIMPGKLEGEAQYLVYSISSTFFNPLTMMTETQTTRIDGLELGGAYGIADKLNAGVFYGFGTGFIGDNEFKIGEGGLALFGNYELAHDKQMTVAGSFDIALDLCGSRDQMTGDCSLTKEIHLGAGARFNVTPQVAVFTGAPYGPGLIGQQLSISLEDGNLTTLSLPVGGMFQATPELGLYVTTTLANIYVHKPDMFNADSTFFGADFIPLTAGGLFAVSEMLDVTAALGFGDLKNNAGDSFLFNVGARAHI